MIFISSFEYLVALSTRLLKASLKYSSSARAVGQAMSVVMLIGLDDFALFNLKIT